MSSETLDLLNLISICEIHVLLLFIKCQCKFIIRHFNKLMKTNISDIRCKIQLDNFDGPLDLLLYLIKKEELDIYDIPISFVTKQYISYLDLMQQLNLEIAGEYLYIASVLLNIKSRMLLPGVVKDDGSTIDPREELTAVLLEHRQFKNTGEFLRITLNKEKLHYPLGKPVLPSTIPTLITVPLDFFDLMRTAWEILKRSEKTIKLPPKDDVDVAEQIEFIKLKIQGKARLTFLELFDCSKVSAAYFVGTFFALLELMRRRTITVKQRTPFGNIWIYRKKAS